MTKKKKKILLTIAIVVLFVPTIIAFIYINFSPKDKPIDTRGSVEVTISDFFGTSEIIEDELLARRVTKNINKADAVIDSVTLKIDELESYVLTVNTDSETKKYTCYMDTENKVCYFKNSEGTYFKFDDNISIELLELQVSQKRLNYANIPEVKINGTLLECLPTTWKYINTLNESASYEAGKNDAVTDVTLPYNEKFSSKISIASPTDTSNLNRAPESVFITVTYKDKTYDATTIEKVDEIIDSFKLSDDTVLAVKITLAWGDGELKTGFYGVVEYNVNLLCDFPAVFEISDKRVGIGALPLLRAKNLDGNPEIEVTVTDKDGELYTAYTPKFYTYENMKIAFLPLGLNEKAGNYTITICESGNTTTLNLNVLPKNFYERSANFSSKKISECYGENKLLSYNLIMESVFSKVIEEKMWDGSKFAAPLKIKLQRGITYGQIIKFGDGLSEKATYTSYIAPAETSVFASNTGEVVYACATSYSGKLVVIEHGYGYKTWYFNLGSIKVDVGDRVNKGDIIGTVGNTGFTPDGTNVVSFAVSVGKVFINPELYFTHGLDYFDKNK